MGQQEEGPHKQDEDEAAVLRVPEQGCLLELETMVVEDYAKFYNHGEGKSNYLIGYKTLCLPTHESLCICICICVPISCLLTMGVGSMPVWHSVL